MSEEKVLDLSRKELHGLMIEEKLLEEWNAFKRYYPAIDNFRKENEYRKEIIFRFREYLGLRQKGETQERAANSIQMNYTKLSNEAFDLVGRQAVVDRCREEAGAGTAEAFDLVGRQAVVDPKAEYQGFEDKHKDLLESTELPQELHKQGDTILKADEATMKDEEPVFGRTGGFDRTTDEATKKDEERHPELDKRVGDEAATLSSEWVAAYHNLVLKEIHRDIRNIDLRLKKLEKERPQPWFSWRPTKKKEEPSE